MDTEIEVKMAKIRDHNPLNSIEIELDILGVDINGAAAPLSQITEIIKVVDSVVASELRKLYNGKFLNLRDIVPLKLSVKIGEGELLV